MGKRKSAFMIGAVWEIIRFALLYFLLLLLMNSSFNPIGSVLLVWFGSVQMITGVALFFVWFDERRYAPFLPLITLAKGINLVPPVLLLLLGSGLFDVGLKLFRAVGGVTEEGAAPSVFAQENIAFLLLFAGVILFFDLIFFFILLSSRTGKKERIPAGESNLPDWDDVKVEED